MPTRPNQTIDPSTATVVDHNGVIQAPPQLQLQAEQFDGNESNDMIQPIDLQGTIDVRVDCQCNAYAKETVHVPYVVIYDALLDEEPNVRVWARDSRITSTRAGGEGPPTNDFKPVHLQQAAANMRQARLIPFSPFARAATLEALRAAQAYKDFVEAYRPSKAPATRNDPQVPVVNLDAVEEQIDPSESAMDLAVSYPDSGTVDEIEAWVGNEARRATYARTQESNRARGPRVTLMSWLDERHPPPVALVEVLEGEQWADAAGEEWAEDNDWATEDK